MTAYETRAASEDEQDRLALLEYERRGPNDRAEIEGRALRAATATGIPHYILSNMTESWVAGQGAKDSLWPDLVPMIVYRPADKQGDVEPFDVEADWAERA